MPSAKFEELYPKVGAIKTGPSNDEALNVRYVHVFVAFSCFFLSYCFPACVILWCRIGMSKH
jgi:hypothetical protein